MIAQDLREITEALRAEGVEHPMDLRDGTLDIDFGYLEAVSIIDGEEPWTYDAIALAWSPDGGITAEHEIVTAAPLPVLAEAVADFLAEREREAAALDAALAAIEAAG